MLTTECHFELVPLDCVDCGGVTGQMGTCADVAYCPPCERYLAGLNNDPKDTARQNITLAEITPYIGTSEEGRNA